MYMIGGKRMSKYLISSNEKAYEDRILRLVDAPIDVTSFIAPSNQSVNHFRFFFSLSFYFPSEIAFKIDYLIQK